MKAFYLPKLPAMTDAEAYSTRLHNELQAEYYRRRLSQTETLPPEAIEAAKQRAAR